MGNFKNQSPKLEIMVDSTTDLMGEEETDRKIKDDYKIESVIGKGTFATVRKGKHRQS